MIEKIILQCGLDEQLILGIGILVGFFVSFLIWYLFGRIPKQGGRE